VALQSQGLWQDKFNGTLFSLSCLLQQDPGQREAEGGRVKQQCHLWWDMPICPWQPDLITASTFTPHVAVLGAVLALFKHLANNHAVNLLDTNSAL